MDTVLIASTFLSQVLTQMFLASFILKVLNQMFLVSLILMLARIPNVFLVYMTLLSSA